MNDIASALATALRAEAEEISMNVDMQKAEETIDSRMQAADRRRHRRSWVALAAAAVAIVAVVLGARAIGGRGTAEPPVGTPTPSASPWTVTTSTMTPNFSIALPAWTRDTDVANTEVNPGLAGWSQQDCSQRPTKVCDAGKDLRLRFFSVRAVYRPQDGPRVTASPTYAQYVAHIAALPTTGTATVSPPSTLTVGGRPATAFTVTPKLEAPGTIACETEFDAAPDCWAGLSPGRVIRLVVVDHGSGLPPTVAVLGMNASNPDQALRISELDTSLASVHFTG